MLENKLNHLSKLTSNNIWRIELNNSSRKIYQFNCEDEEEIDFEDDDSENEDEILFRRPTFYSNINIKKNY